MLSVFDLVAYILDKQNPIITIKLQKIVYYCQAWSLVWDEKPLFKEKIEAWTSSPVVRELYQYCHGYYSVQSISKGNKELLNNEQKETVLAVLDYYGDKSPEWLNSLTYIEDPWKLARKGIPEGERSSKEITLVSMEEYYNRYLKEPRNADSEKIETKDTSSGGDNYKYELSDEGEIDKHT